MTLAYAWVLQYWAKGVSPPASTDYHPLAMSVVELRWHMGRYDTLSKHDILKDLGSAIHETQDWDMESPQADPVTSSTTTGVEDTLSCPMGTQWVDKNIFPSPRHQSKAKIKDEEASLADPTTSPATSDAKDTQSSPTETSLADHITVPLAELNPETQKDLLTALVTSLAELESQVAPTTRSVDESAVLPTPSGHMAKEELGVPALTSSMEALKLEAPQWWPPSQGLQ